MLITILRRHLSYEADKQYDVPDETAQLYIQNGLAAPVIEEADFGTDEIPAVVVKNKGGRPRNKPKE